MARQGLRRFAPLVFVVVLVIAGLAYLAVISGPENGPLRASGTVAAVEVGVAPELAGRVAEVFVEEGQSVPAGERLFSLDDSLLRAQRQRAEAAQRTAAAGLQTAEAGLDAARLQYDLALAAARAQDQAARPDAWRQAPPWEFTLPAWYFGRGEELAAAEAEFESADQALTEALRAWERLLEDPALADLRSAETRLVQALLAFQVADDVYARANAARDTQALLDQADEQRQAARDELEAAQAAYDDLLSEEGTDAVEQARAGLALARAGREAALDRLNRLRTGEYALAVRAAEAGVAQAEAAVTQARAVIEQARAELAALDVQLGKLVVRAPVDGVVLTRSLEPGEVVMVGGEVMTLGRLDQLTITVYVPEERYGAIRLGDRATIRVDSFPGETFEAEVARIADQAEFTPRNVQTEEGRRTTVFAVELSLNDPQGRLKPGMPADVTFDEAGA